MGRAGPRHRSLRRARRAREACRGARAAGLAEGCGDSADRPCRGRRQQPAGRGRAPWRRRSRFHPTDHRAEELGADARAEPVTPGDGAIGAVGVRRHGDHVDSAFSSGGRGVDGGRSAGRRRHRRTRRRLGLSRIVRTDAQSHPEHSSRVLGRSSAVQRRGDDRRERPER